MKAIEQIESAVATIEIELAYIKAAIDKLRKKVPVETGGVSP